MKGGLEDENRDRKPMTLSLILALVAFAAELSALEAEAASTRELRSAVSERHLRDALRFSEALEQPTAEDRYLTGLALMYLHDPQGATPHLRSAKTGDFRSWPGWPDLDLLLERAETCRTLEPPSRFAPSVLAHPSITVHAGPTTPWSGPLLDALPEFEHVGRSIFGEDIPPMRLYLFAERDVYNRFFEALFGMQVQTAWQDATGNFNVVVSCEEDREGKVTRKPGDPDTIAGVLHEFGHAWIITYLMYRHGREWLEPGIRRPWLDEGLADFIASLREPALILRRETWLRQAAARGTRPPTLERIRNYDGFYHHDDVDVHYWISAVLVADLLGPRDHAPETIRSILDATGRSSAEEAVRTVTGKDIPGAFEKVVRRFW